MKIILIILLIISTLQAQNYTSSNDTEPKITDSTGSLLIKVSDSHYGSPIYTQVEIKELGIYRMTDNYGTCVYNGLKEGKYSIVISAVGFEQLSDTIMIHEKTFNYLFFKMTDEYFGKGYERKNSLLYISPYFSINFYLLKSPQAIYDLAESGKAKFSSSFKFRRGDKIYPFVMFNKNFTYLDGKCDFSYSLEIFSSDGNLFFADSNLIPWEDVEFPTLDPSKVILEICSTEKNLLGEYKICITIFDKINKQCIRMTSFFELIDPNIY